MAIPNTTYRMLVEKMGGRNPSTFIGNEGEVFFDPDSPSPTLRLSDGSTAGGIQIGGGGGGNFSGNYNDLTNTPTIPSDVSDLTDNTSLLFSGDYTDLSNKPSLFSGDYDDLSNKPSLFSGDYGDLSNTPTIPSDVSDLTDNTNLLGGGGGFSGDYNDLTNTPTIPSDVSDLTDTTSLLFSGDYTDLSNKPSLFSGDYGDLTNTPTIPDDVSDLTDTTNLLFSGDYTDLTNKPTLFSGSYDDLTNKPTVDELVENFGTYSTSISSGATVSFDCSTACLWYVTSTVSGNWTASITNMNIAANQTSGVSFIIEQGATAYLPTALSINGTNVTISWQGGSPPSGNASKKDVITFSALQTGASTYVVFGQLVTFG